MMKIHIRTYGCQMNERDSEALGVLLEEAGHAVTADEADADVIIVNTCSVRGKAEAKALGKLGLLTRRRSNGRPLVGAAGCMVQRLQTRIFEKVPGLDFAVGTYRFSAVPRLLERVAAGQRGIIESGGEARPGDVLQGHAAGRVTASINILLGCDRRCTYCIVPAVRGPERSRTAADILAEVRTATDRGAAEILLLGQSVMSYGRRGDVWVQASPSPGGFREPLPRLLEAVARIRGVQRVRFTSGHPSGCTTELARAVRDIPQVCEHLHLPLQSGSDRILKMMRRGYGREDYRRAIAELRRFVPGAAITTDIIVGFPSETERDFEETATLMDEVGFDNAFIFKYSPRSGTRAAEWKDDVPEAVKRSRNQLLLQEQDRRSLAINRALVGCSLEVLAEGPSSRDETRWSGRTRTNKIAVFAPRPGLKPGETAVVSIESARPQTLYGRVEGKVADSASDARCVECGTRCCAGGGAHG